MAWPTMDRNKPLADPPDRSLLTEEVKAKIRSFFDRYETKKAVMLPALHIVQESLGFISWRAMEEIAEVLELSPSEVFDVVTFYTHYWMIPRGKKTIVVCRSITCDVLGAGALLDAFQQHLGITVGETTPDGAYSLATEECLALCDHSPCVLINEKKHGGLRPEDVPALLADSDNDKVDVPRSDLYDPVLSPAGPPNAADARGPGRDERT